MKINDYKSKPERFLDKGQIAFCEEFARHFNNPHNETAEVEKTFVIGDTHGMEQALLDLLKFIQEENSSCYARLVFIGDYVDRGPDVAGVIAIVRLLEELMDVVPLMGNHEDMLLEEYRVTKDVRSDGHIFALGRDSYIGATGKSFKGRGFPVPPRDVIAWIEGLSLMFEDELHFYVHGGLDPKKTMLQQRPDDILWIRNSFLFSNYDFGKEVYHGHTPHNFEVSELGSQNHNKFRVNVDYGAVFSFKDNSLAAAEVSPSKRKPVRMFHVSKGKKWIDE